MKVVSHETRSHWEFFNADHEWVKAISGKEHALTAAESNYHPGRIRKVTVMTTVEEPDNDPAIS